ncbi:MAG: DUF192 domain-containing protein [Deltaproteobacteria bacterium]|nr:DUF192 domain-containing protein [Deltaproteobacteria bacterium]
MKKIRVVNYTIQKPIFENAVLTENFLERALGLMFKSSPLGFDALVIDKCDAVHSFFMRFDIDLIFLNREKIVMKIQKRLTPFKISSFVTGAYYVIETISHENTEENFSCGDVIDFLEN